MKQVAGERFRASPCVKGLGWRNTAPHLAPNERTLEPGDVDSMEECNVAIVDDHPFLREKKFELAQLERCVSSWVRPIQRYVLRREGKRNGAT